MKDGCSDAQCQAVVDHLNKWMRTIEKYKERFIPEYSTVLNSIRISNMFVMRMTRAACLAVLGRAQSGCAPRVREAVRGVLHEQGREALQCRHLHTRALIDALWLPREVTEGGEGDDGGATHAGADV